MDDNELKIISEISKNSGASQRHLSKAADISLGTVNIILHRLIEKGYMKIKQLDGRKVQYMLTPKGFAEKVERSKQYLKKTIYNVGAIKAAIAGIISKEKKSGNNVFYAVGGGDLSHFIDIASRELEDNGVLIKHYKDIKDVPEGRGVLFLTEGFTGDVPKGDWKVIDLVKELGEVLI